MPTYISLLNWTDQGIRAYEDTVQRAELFAAALEEMGARLVDLYWTVGQYDLVTIIEAPDDETAAAALLRNGGAGNVRSTTLRAFGRDEVNRVIAKAKG
ncbi:GYD domain-containing protein [Actinomadura sp. NBRC 104425]|uniref:GYD domain-containing protein n=1 Tax=Actinomadura sp. NBRC 104425 TaxID=3032204 RepID=UPI0024A24EE8|nr:GYD domain-containing protein [Actinomadura sp. NBRC 104425]GLZ14698.1 GYD domain-containing protein [Actinomadura sp. NBRC 104425]